MADINLLQNTNVPKNDESKFKLANSLGVALLVIVVLALIATFLLSMQTDKEIKRFEADNAALDKDIKAQKDYSNLARDQKKLNEISVLLNQHLSWSQVMPSFAKATLKSSRYTKYVANQDGSATITGVVPDFQDLDKLIKGFQLPEFDYIKDVKLTNVAISAEGKNGITYTITVTFDKNKLLELTKDKQANANTTK